MSRNDQLLFVQGRQREGYKAMNDELRELEKQLMNVLGCDTSDGEFIGNYVKVRNPEYGSDEPDFVPLYPVQLFDDLMHLITTHTLRARVDELSLAIKMAGKAFVSRDKVLMDLTNFGMGDPDNISAEVLKTRLTTLTAQLNHQKSQKEGE